MLDEYHRHIRRIDLAILLTMTLGVLAIVVVAANDRAGPARIAETMRR